MHDGRDERRRIELQHLRLSRRGELALKLRYAPRIRSDQISRWVNLLHLLGRNEREPLEQVVERECSEESGISGRRKEAGRNVVSLSYQWSRWHELRVAFRDERQFKE